MKNPLIIGIILTLSISTAFAVGSAKSAKVEGKNEQVRGNEVKVAPKETAVLTSDAATKKLAEFIASETMANKPEVEKFIETELKVSRKGNIVTIRGREIVEKLQAAIKSVRNSPRDAVIIAKEKSIILISKLISLSSRKTAGNVPGGKSEENSANERRFDDLIENMTDLAADAKAKEVEVEGYNRVAGQMVDAMNDAPSMMKGQGYESGLNEVYKVNNNPEKTKEVVEKKKKEQEECT